MGRRQDRTFTGCWKCRSRKVKCDESKPFCRACGRLGVPCPGYGGKFVWVEDEGNPCQSSGRQLMPCESTWKGFQTLSSQALDELILACDMDTFSADGNPEPSIQEPPLHHTRGPFSVFPLEATTNPRDVIVRSTSSSVTQQGEQRNEVPRQMPTTLMTTDRYDSFLFEHYLNHVSSLMLPYYHPRNPWKWIFPMAAVSGGLPEERALYHSIMAHTAFHLWHLNAESSMLFDVGSRHYVLAIRSLISALSCESSSTSTIIASILGLMYAQVYQGSNYSWMHHYDGTRSLLPRLLETIGECLDELSFAALHSFNIIKIIGDTSIIASLVHDDVHNETAGTPSDLRSAELSIRSQIFATSDFGFTIGAHPDILRCIERITQFNRARYRQEKMYESSDDFIFDTLSVLNSHRRDVEQNAQSLRQFGVLEKQNQLNHDLLSHCNVSYNPEKVFQEAAFIYATYIYLYRTVHDVLPHIVQGYVAKTFKYVSSFSEVHDGNFSFWPAFVAAAEAYKEDDLLEARKWLFGASSIGMTSRKSARHVLEEIWRRRDAMSASSGLDLGQISIDWRLAMAELGYEVLLI